MDTPEDIFHLGVKTLIRNPSNQILLLQKNHRTKGILWDIPGGRLQKGETLLQTLQRELEEETGLQNVPTPTFLTTLLTDIRIDTPLHEVGLILFVYHTTLPTPFTPRLSPEHFHFDWFAPRAAASLLINQYPPDFIAKVAGL